MACKRESRAAGSPGGHGGRTSCRLAQRLVRDATGSALLARPEVDGLEEDREGTICRPFRCTLLWATPRFIGVASARNRPVQTRRGMVDDKKSVAIALEGVSKRFGKAAAVDDVSLAIGEGEFFSMLGPSGCGKTTTLRMIAGFEVPDEGRIVLAGRGRDAVLAPNKRPVEHGVPAVRALPAHVDLRQRRLRAEGEARAADRAPRPRRSRCCASSSSRASRAGGPRQLSGGQQQRVALARALVNRPAALLLDEPLGALDVKLRKQMQLELKRIQHELGTTFVYVTHDQEEALAMSDRIAVMNGGRGRADRQPARDLRASAHRRSSPTSSAR